MTQESKEYQLANDVILHECSIIGDTGGYVHRLCPYSAKFTLVRSIGPQGVAPSAYVVAFYDWATSTTLKTKTKYRAYWWDRDLREHEEEMAYRYNYDPEKIAAGEREADRYFLITADELKQNAVPFEGGGLSAIFGTAVLPFKYRPQSGVVTKDVSLGGIGGIRLNGSRDNGIALCLGAAFSSITVDSLNTNGEVKESKERAALTLPIGLVVDRDRIQFGVFIGWDMLFDDDSGWRYQGQPWFGVAVGMSVFTQTIDKAKKNN